MTINMRDCNGNYLFGGKTRFKLTAIILLHTLLKHGFTGGYVQNSNLEIVYEK